MANTDIAQSDLGNPSTVAAALHAQHGLPGRVNFTEMFSGPVAVLRLGDAEAIVAVQGAQVLSYVPAQGGEVFWLSPSAKLGTGKAVRGGVPICWPWFGPHPEGGDRPAHGLVRARPWTIVRSDATDTATTLRLALSHDALSSPQWSHAADVALDVVLTADALTLSLSTHNAGAAPVSITGALHSYFRVRDIADVTVEGLRGVPYLDQLAPGELRTDHDAIRIAGEVDRIYQGACAHVRVCDGTRALHIDSQGSGSCVVWNPWIEKSARLGDMGAEGFRTMVCVETANAGCDVRVIAPHDTHVLVARIRAEPHGA